MISRVDDRLRNPSELKRNDAALDEIRKSVHCESWNLLAHKIKISILQDNIDTGTVIT